MAPSSLPPHTAAVAAVVNPASQASTLCPGSSQPMLTAAQLARVVFAEQNQANATVGSIFGTCSFGKSQLTQGNSRVADLVRLPCTDSR